MTDKIRIRVHTKKALCTACPCISLSWAHTRSHLYVYIIIWYLYSSDFYFQKVFEHSY